MERANYNTEELLQLAAAMRRAVRIKDRRYLFRSYRRCFVGQEAVAWLVSMGAVATPAAAVRLGNRMMEMGIFHHVVYEHLFEDDYLFYRFTDDDTAPADGGPGALRLISPRGSPTRPGKLKRSSSTGGLRGAALTPASAATPPGFAGRAGGGGQAAGAGQTSDGGSRGNPVRTSTASSGGGTPGVSTVPSAAGSGVAATDLGAGRSAGAPATSSTGEPGDTASSAAAGGPNLSGMLLLSEPRPDRSRQVLTGHLQQLQGRVTQMSQAADAQRAIVDILVSEVSVLRGEVSDLKSRLHDQATQLGAANATVAHGSQQVAGLRLLTLGLCACLLQQALMHWLEGPAGGGGGGAGGGIMVLWSGGMSCWGSALAVAMTILSLAVLLPIRIAPPRSDRAPAVTAAVPPLDGGLPRFARSRPAAVTFATDAAGGFKEECPADVGVSSAYASASEADSGTAVHHSPRVSVDATVVGKGVLGPSAVATAAGGASQRCRGDVVRALGGGSVRGSFDALRRCTEVVRAMTAPVRLHLPGKACPDEQALREASAAAVAARREGGQQRHTSMAREAVEPLQRESAIAAVATEGTTSGGLSTVSAQLICTVGVGPDSGSAVSSGVAAAGAGHTVSAITAATTAAASGGVAAAAAGPRADIGVLDQAAPAVPPRTAVPCLSDFMSWPDAPVLLAFDTGAVPEHAQGAVPQDGTGADSSCLQRGGSGLLAGVSAILERLDSKAPVQGTPTATATAVHLSVTSGTPSGTLAQGHPAQGHPTTPNTHLRHFPSAPTFTAIASDGSSAATTAVAPLYGALASATDGSPSPPLTPVAASDAGAPRPFLAPTPGLVRLPANGVRPIRIETELFSGELAVFVRGLATSNEEMFQGKKRMSWVAMQGRFKQPLAVDSVVTGQEFARPFKRLPAPWFVERVLLSMARQVSPSMRVGPLSSPRLTMPILAAAQLVNVSKQGSQLPMMECREDVRLYCPSLSSSGGRQPASSDARRRHFSSRRNRAGLVYDTEHVWTFHFWQQFVDIASYKLDFGYTYDLVQHLDGQPLQVMARHEDTGRYLYNVLIWHERLLPNARAATPGAAGPEGPAYGYMHSGSLDGMEEH